MTEETFATIVAEGAFDGLSLPAKRRGGRRSRDKGNRSERALVNSFLDAGITAERVPLSGAAGGSYVGDLTFAALGEDWVAESKVRAGGFASIYRWLAPVRALFVKQDRAETLVVLRLSDFIDLVKGKRG
jgi:Holliday junction resolvase